MRLAAFLVQWPSATSSAVHRCLCQLLFVLHSSIQSECWSWVYTGNHEKAASILNKALRAGAEPPEVLQSLLQELEAHAVRATPCLPAAARPTPGSQVRPAAKVELSSSTQQIMLHSFCAAALL